MSLLTALLLLAAGQGPDLGRPLDRDAAPWIMPALSKCIGASGGKPAKASDPSTIPPGLVEGNNVAIAPLPHTDGHAFSYEGTNPRAASCGVALYGAVDSGLREQMRRLVADDPRWVLSPGFYTGPADATTSYWGDRDARGLRGVAIIIRPLSPDAPTIEVEYRSTLVR